MNNVTTTEAGTVTATLGLVGAGKMGTAMLDGWLSKQVLAAPPLVIEPLPSGHIQSLADQGKINLNAAAEADQLDVLIIAVKPQIMSDVLKELRIVGPRTLLISIAAGKTIEGFEKILGSETPVIRAMPNTPAAIGLGITAAVVNAHVSDTQRALCTTLLSAVGDVVWVEREGLIDAVTAVSGSGPAYVFYMIECLASAAREAGLPAELADQLAVATVHGAGVLAAQSDEPPNVLRQNVTSPGGTTAAGLDILMGSDGLAPLMRRVIKAATQRSKELRD